MIGAWTPYFRLGIVHFMAFPETQKDESQLLPTLEQIAMDPAFEAIEVQPIRDRAIRRQAQAMLAAAHLTVAFCAQPLILGERYDLNAADEGLRAKAVDALKGLLEDAAEFGAEAVALMSGPDPGPEGRPAARQALRTSLVELCEHARQLGLFIVLEVFDRDVDKRALIGPTVEAVELAQAVRQSVPNFGLMLDLSHLPLQREPVQEALTQAAPYLVHAHMGNCVLSDATHPAYGDQHPRFGLPGGENDVSELAAYLRGLREIGFLGDRGAARPIVSFEVKPQPGESSALVIANAKRTLIAAWAQVAG
ncbi:MAG TPA: TIM barrel protein [Limnochordia bacterium]